MATMLLMSHHAFRRDIVQLARALQRLRDKHADNALALQQEWQGYRGALHGHHGMEDANIFPSLAGEQPGLKPVLARLSADHQRIDPLLERGDRAFATIGQSTAAAQEVVAELAAMLDAHLSLEEASIVPALRNSRDFPSPSNETEAALYADGFAWSSHGIAPEVLERVYALLPEMLASRIPAARVTYRERCLRSWGSTEAGESRTSVPNWL
jgi:hemerythrin-like domain-containing protein